MLFQEGTEIARDWCFLSALVRAHNLRLWASGTSVQWHLSVPPFLRYEAMFFWCGAVFFSPKPTSKHSVPPCALGFQKLLSGISLSLSFSFYFFHFILMDQLYCRYRVRHSNRLGGLAGKESICNAGDLGSIPGLGRSPGGGHGNPLQYSCLENPHGQRSLVGHSPLGCKELDMTE